MRTLFITRGIPGSGKSTFLQQTGLVTYTLSPDTIRLTMAAPRLTCQGRMAMPAHQDPQVWKLLYQLIEQRMVCGETTVVDATHTTDDYFEAYRQLCQRYRYQLVVIDFSGVALATCRVQNRRRPAYKVVPDEVLTTMYQQLQQSTVPDWATIVTTTEEVDQLLANRLEQFDNYRRIHHVSGVQGCHRPLREYFRQYPLRDDELYIFVGDLFDRGSENGAAMQCVCDDLLPRPNVRFVEGNHDLYLWQWATNQPITGREFADQTRPQLEAAAIDKSVVRQLFSRMDQYILYQFHAKTVLVTHGGLSTLPEQLPLLATDQLIYGVGRYDDAGAVDDAFVATTRQTTYQIHGYRNAPSYPIRYNQRCYSLGGGVEHGGEVRAVQLDKQGMTPVTISY